MVGNSKRHCGTTVAYCPTHRLPIGGYARGSYHTGCYDIGGYDTGVYRIDDCPIAGYPIGVCTVSIT